LAKAARPVIRPTVRAGTMPSDGETVAPLEPPRLQDGATRPRGHALAETVGLRPLAGVGLVCALHVNSAFRDVWASPMSRTVAGGHASAIPGNSAGGGESFHVRRDLSIGSSRIGPSRCTFIQLPAPRIVPNIVAGRRGGEKGVLLG